MKINSLGEICCHMLAGMCISHPLHQLPIESCAVTFKTIRDARHLVLAVCNIQKSGIAFLNFQKRPSQNSDLLD